MKIISSKKAPAAIGPYSQAVFAGDTLYVSGQIALDPVTGNLVDKNIEEETKQIMRNLLAILTEAGVSFANVVKATIFVTDMAYFGAVNEIYGQCFRQNPPARCFVQVAALPKGARVEIEMTAVK